VTDEHLAALCAQCTSLKDFSLVSKSIGKSGVLALAAASFLSSLRSLALKSLSVSDDCYSSLLASLHSIRSLQLHGLFGLTDASFQTLSNRSTHLSELSVASCENVNGSSFSAVLQPHPMLDTLDLSFTQPSLIDAVNFVSSFRCLRSLDVSFCSTFNSDDALLSVLPHLLWLKDLRLEALKDISDNVVKVMTFYNKALEALSLADCHGLSDKVFSFLGMLKRLKHLELHHCGQLDPVLGAALKDKLLYLEHLTLPKKKMAAERS